MAQFLGVPGPSQDEFNALSGQVTALNDNLATKAKHIVLESGDNTWAKIWAKINTLSNLETATFYSTYQATTVWGGGVKSVAIQGTISRVSASQFEIIGKYATNNLVCIRLTDVSSSSAGTYSENDITSKMTDLMYLKHFNNTEISLSNFGQYNTALCSMLMQGIGSSAFAIYRSGNTISKVHLAGAEAATNGVTITYSGDAITLTSTNRMTITMMFGYLG